MTPLISAVPTAPAPSHRLRIAVLSRVFAPTGGGAERYSIALVEQLAARHEIHVFAQAIDHHWPGVTYHRVPMPLRKPRWLNQLWFAATTWWDTRRGFDVVHSHENTWHGNVQTVHVLPVKYTLFSGRHGWRKTLRWLKALSSPRLLAYLGLEQSRYTERPGRKIVATSDSLRNIMAQTYPFSSAMLSVITPGVVLPEWPFSPELKQAARTRLGLPHSAHCLLFVGNDYRKKGLPALLQAMAKLASHDVSASPQGIPADTVLAVVGNPADVSDFRGQVHALRLEERVFFLGSLNDVGPAYMAADCLVHPTLEDTFAMVVLEAMAHGLPVIVSGPRHCGISSLLEQGTNALLLDDPRDASAISRLISQILGEQSLRDRLAQEARVFAARHQWQTLAARQEALYCEVAEINESNDCRPSNRAGV